MTLRVEFLIGGLVIRVFETPDEAPRAAARPIVHDGTCGDQNDEDAVDTLPIRRDCRYSEI